MRLCKFIGIVGSTILAVLSAGAAETSPLCVAVTSRKGGGLAFRVTRTGTAATSLHLVHGAAAGGRYASAWAKDDVIGNFTADGMVCEVDSPILGSSDLYVRLFTEDGAWSRTILTTGILDIPRGTMVILR